jgi:phosphatidylserine/phosphatidylglycerophosphate/cardiolipin synthase-like enzyme
MSPNIRRSTSATFTILIIAAILLIYQAISGENGASPVTTASVDTQILPPTADWYSVYFTDPNTTAARTYKGGPDEDLAAAIDRARMSVDIAAYDLDLWSVRDALLAAQRRGCSVRMVTDSDYLDDPEVQELVSAGIPVLGDRREGLMHNKFVIIDRLEVWSGSMNFTANGAYKNNNNLIRIRSSRLAEDYTTEFNEMFVDDQFGPSSPANTPNPTLSVDGTLIEVYFSPDDGTSAHLVNLIKGANKSISFLAYSFTSDDIALAMLDQAQRGVSVSGVFEASQVRSNSGDEYEHLHSAGLDVRLDGNPYNMHHKLIILDGQIVITGSYNFTASAETRNDENTLVIHDPGIAAAYAAEFQKVFSEAQK